MLRKHTKRIIGIGLVFVLVLGFASLFPRKVKFQETITACSYEGEIITAKFDVELWKYWYMKDAMKGNVTVDGVSYEHLEYESYGKESASFWFAVPKGNMLDRVKNSLHISMYGEDFETFILAINQNNESKMYVGPAETVEEVKKIEHYFVED